MECFPATHSLLSRWREYRAPIAAFAFSVGITATIFAYREKLADLAGFGYLGIFLISVLSNATIAFPVPGIAAVFAGGGVLNPLLVALVAGLGEPLGEMTGYVAGYGGSAIIRDTELFERVRPWVERRGFLTLFVLSLIPNPLFDLAGIAAGIIRFPVYRFLFACWLGKTLKALIISYLGSLSLNLIEPWLR